MFKNLRINIKISLVIALLMFISVFTLTIIVYKSSSSSLTKKAESNLISVRDLKKSFLEDKFNMLEKDIFTLSSSPATINAISELSDAFLSTADTPSECAKLIRKAYITENIKKQKDQLMAAGDGTYYSDTHRNYHPTFLETLKNYGYYDIFLIEPEKGYIVYTVEKEKDFGTSLLTGPYKNTNAGKLFRKILKGKKNTLYFSDFENYPPSENKPAMFIGAQIYNEDMEELDGVLIIQLPYEFVNNIMQISTGMGKSGETYLVGPDLLMRSDSRFSKEPTILRQKVNTESAKAVISGKTGGGLTKDYRNIPVLSAYTPVKIDGLNWGLIAEIDKSEVLLPVKKLFNIMSLIFIITLIIAIFAGYIFANIIAKPLSNMAEFLKTLTSGKWDLSKRIKINSKDETGLLAAQFNLFMDTLQELIGSVTTASDSLYALSEELSSSAETLANSSESQAASTEEATTSIEEVSAATEEVSNETQSASLSATKLAEEAENTKEKVENIKNDSLKVAQETKKVQESIIKLKEYIEESTQLSKKAKGVSEKTKTSSEKGNQAIDNVVSGMERISYQVEGLSNVVGELGKASEEIGKIIEVISDIAEQTNLLALNAAIEAARAGESGRGFAVVADEVRKLAERSQQAAGEIGSLIKDIQIKVKNAVSTSKASKEEVQKGIKLTETAGSSFGEISGHIEELVKIIAKMAENMNIQEEEGSVVVNLTNTSVENLSRTAGFIGSAADSVKNISDMIIKISDELSRIAAATEEETSSMSEIKNTMVSISDEIQKTAAISEELNAGINTLKGEAERLREIIERFEI